MITDMNDNDPAFIQSSWSLSIPEGQNFSSPVYITATDADKGENSLLSYSIINQTRTSKMLHVHYIIS